MSKVKSSVIVPLDGMTEEQSLDIAQRLKGRVWGFKVNDLLVEKGPGIITKLKSFGNVFADPKFYDIPNTVANSVSRISAAGADLITVHASGGEKMIEAAVKSSGSAKILAVTILTSFSPDQVKKIYCADVLDRVVSFTQLALDSGADGIVCSPNELLQLPSLEKGYLRVVPGIRPTWYEKVDDQHRVATPAGAIERGASYLVIGRPITNHSDPLEAVKLIEQELES